MSAFSFSSDVCVCVCVCVCDNESLNNTTCGFDVAGLVEQLEPRDDAGHGKYTVQTPTNCSILFFYYISYSLYIVETKRK